MRASSHLAFLGILGLFLEPSMVQADYPEVSQLPSQSALPDPLIFLNGDRVRDRDDWNQKRRPELKALFQHYMYGVFPPAPDRVTGGVEREDRHCFGGKATKREVTVVFGPPEMPRIHLLLVVPNQSPKPVPVFVGMNFCGNHALVKDPSVRLPATWIYSNYPGVKKNRATEAGRGKQTDVWCLEDSIDHGYAVATFYSGDISPDRPDDPDSIQACFRAKGLSKPGTDEWGTIAAWAWGISRAVDYLRTDRDIDKERIAVVGHSRLGKTALLAAAMDERIALSIPHQAGCGGTAPSRGKIGESVKKINDSFPHWFDGEFKKFNDQPDRLPFDQHCLVALVAPRPVLLSNAVQDTWANPAGQFEVLKAADPVYRLLGVEGLGASQMPPLGQLVPSRLAYFIRPGQHSMTREDWKVFWEFADKHLQRPQP